jgi:hypothetical protein
MKDNQATEASTLKREHLALQNMIFLHFLIFWVIFALLDTDLDLHSQIGSRPS